MKVALFSRTEDRVSFTQTVFGQWILFASLHDLSSNHLFLICDRFPGIVRVAIHVGDAE
jgi:hypothetical protein